MTVVPIILFWTLMVLAFVRRGPLLIHLFFCSMAFETFAVLPTAATGGLTITPTPAVALALIVRTFGSADGLRRFIALALRPDRLGLLFGFWLVAVYATAFMPQLFAGAIGVIPFRGDDLSRVVPLAPSTQNLSQLLYLTLSVFTVFAFADRLQSVEHRQEAVRGLAVGGVMVAITGSLDFLSQFLPIGPVLEPFRTASYALLTEVVVLGGKRVVGLTSEASSFGALSLSYLILLFFLRRTIESRPLRQTVVPITMIVLAVLVYLAKSTGAYVGLALFAGVVVVDGCRRYMNARRRYRAAFFVEFWVLYVALLAFLLALIINPNLLDPVFDLMNRMVFEKASSESFEERGLWRSTAWEAFRASYGAGIGVGSTRSSSTVAGIFAATGIFGALFYYGFVLQTLFRRATRFDLDGQEIVKTMRMAVIPSLVVGYFNGSADFGAMTAFVFGLVSAIAFMPAPRRNATTDRPRQIRPPGRVSPAIRR